MFYEDENKMCLSLPRFIAIKIRGPIFSDDIVCCIILYGYTRDCHVGNTNRIEYHAAGIQNTKELNHPCSTAVVLHVVILGPQP